MSTGGEFYLDKNRKQFQGSQSQNTNLQWRFEPPSSSAPTTSPVAALTSGGPAKNM